MNDVLPPQAGGLTIAQLLDRTVRRYSAQVALIGPDGETWTYQRLGDCAYRLANAWRDMGVGQGARIALWMPNCCEYVVTEYAAALIGATRVPIAKASSDEDVIDFVNRSKCIMLVYSAAFARRLARISASMASVQFLVVVGDQVADDNPDETHQRMHCLIASYDALQTAEKVNPEQIAAIHFTGGTTGRPKGVMLSHRALVETYRAAITELEIGWNERFLAATPLTHASGYLVPPVLLRGGSCVIVEQFQPADFLARVERYAVTTTFLVPTMIAALLDDSLATPKALSTLTNVIYGASAIAPARLRAAIDRFGPIFTQLFGQTEAPMTILAMRRQDHLADGKPAGDKMLSAAGWSTLHTDVRIIHDDGAEAAPGAAGEIVVRATNLMSGYLDDPSATAQTIREGWLYTGDIGSRDESGLVTISDRNVSFPAT